MKFDFFLDNDGCSVLPLMISLTVISPMSLLGGPHLAVPFRLSGADLQVARPFLKRTD